LGDQESKREIVRLAKIYYDRQWMFATAGNLSFRSITPEQFWITASGKNKNSLTDDDFVCIEIASMSLLNSKFNNKPSAETSIHRSIYNFFPIANSILHVHTLSSNLLNFNLSKVEKYRLVPIPNIEIIKAFGIWDEKPNLEMAVFYNFGEVNQIAESISQFLIECPNYKLPFVLVEEHGPTVWGPSIDITNRYLEATAFLFDIMKEIRK